ncbi:hypothetical protein L596_007176 [Steinernema carpocapsae]|uniref:Solute carrier family 35 member F5 n=1 Tax=Steinernema carpocapsae TaxID=34508 RepID=A0A4U5P9H4_STECR|nr:hypothetical protein L596_007176 [Steinernema carpocapsae]
MNILFGVIGLTCLVAGTPLLYFLHISGIEKITPWPTEDEWVVLLASGIFGTVISDYLCLYASALTGSLTASLSFTLSIPFSMIADVLFRHRPPTSLQIIAAIPIVLSFVGAALLGRSMASSTNVVTGIGKLNAGDIEMKSDFERENLIHAVYDKDDEDDDEESRNLV